MASLAQVRKFLENSRGQETLIKIYGDRQGVLTAQQDRYLALTRQFESVFPDHREVEVCSAPGRTEVGGNHTDHENGRVLAAAVNLDTVGIAARNGEEVICIHSAGYTPIEVQLDDLEPHPGEQNTPAAMVRGICKILQQNEGQIGGFFAVMTSAVPSGTGLSSSAAFEILTGEILNCLFNQGRLPALVLARAGQFAEMEYFKKPCGLMDQMMSAVGGMATMDFTDPSKPVVRQVKFDLEASGHVLVITKTGGSHADLTDEYAGIKEENRAVAQFFGVSVLRDVEEGDFRADLPELRKQVGDRAVLRAIHFFDDNQRVLEEVDALESGTFDHFLRLVNESGRSSWTLLQNCYSNRNPTEQGIPLGLTLSAEILGRRGAWRVHGGGFAGTVQAFVPQDLLKDYVNGMERVFGRGACLQLSVRPEGTTSMFVKK